MKLNKPQKIATLSFAASILITIFFLTPCQVEYSNRETVGNFFLIDEERVIFYRLYMEIGLFSFLYVIALILLSGKKSN